jgi:hypothetical protein
MNLYDKIKTIYPELTDDDFGGLNATIYLRNDSDGKGDYIEKWTHPVYPQPSKEQLGD